MRVRNQRRTSLMIGFLLPGLFLVMGFDARKDSCPTPTCSIVVDLPPALRGFVFDAVTEAPLGGAVVTLGDKSASTNEQGWYVLSDLSVGIFDVQAAHDGYVTAKRAVRVNDSPYNEADFFLQPKP